jgi:uncharacterized RDD family membrane protein YckC
MTRKGLNLPKERTFKGPALIWKRVLAFLADILVLNLVVFFPFKKILSKMIPDLKSYSEAYNFILANQSYSKVIVLVSVVMALFAILYFVLLQYKLKQTIGMMLFNISVISEIKKLSVLQCIIRSIFLIPIFPFFLLWIIDPLFMIFTKTNQRLSEVLSKTKTVETYII